MKTVVQILSFLLFPLTILAQPLSPPQNGTNGGGALITGWKEPTTYYVSPTALGSDTASGTSRATPFATYTNAADVASSNAPATIVLMAGNYIFPGTNNSIFDIFLVPPMVNIVGEPSNQVICTFTNTDGILSIPAETQFCGTNTITGVNFIFYAGCSSDIPLGNFGGTGQVQFANYAGLLYSVPLNIPVNFINDTFMFSGTGIHFEFIGATNIYPWDFNGCKFTCNNNFVQIREAGPLVTVENSDVTMLNWTNVPVINSKPFRLIETRTAPNIFSNIWPVRISNTRIHVNDSDQSNSNRYFTLLSNTQNLSNNLVVTNLAMLANCIVDETITNPASVDITGQAFNANTNSTITLNNCIRLDSNQTFTVAPGYSLRSLVPTTQAPTNTIINPIVSGGFWTNTNAWVGTLTINTSESALTSSARFTNVNPSGVVVDWYQTTNLAATAAEQLHFRMQPLNWLVATQITGTLTIGSSSFQP